jgi:hypothetical protein
MVHHPTVANRYDALAPSQKQWGGVMRIGIEAGNEARRDFERSEGGSPRSSARVLKPIVCLTAALWTQPVIAAAGSPQGTEGSSRWCLFCERPDKELIEWSGRDRDGEPEYLWTERGVHRGEQRYVSYSVVYRVQIQSTVVTGLTFRSRALKAQISAELQLRLEEDHVVTVGTAVSGHICSKWAIYAVDKWRMGKLVRVYEQQSAKPRVTRHPIRVRIAKTLKAEPQCRSGR